MAPTDTRTAWAHRGRSLGFIRRNVYWIDKVIGGKRIRISTCCTTPAAALAEYERFELDPAGFVNRVGKKAFGKSRKPRGSSPVDLERAAALRDGHTFRNYNTTSAELDALARVQGDRCAICGTHRNDLKGAALDVDHDHATGAVRGLLCGPCNRGIGQFGDSIELLAKAIVYLSNRPTTIDAR